MNSYRAPGNRLEEGMTDACREAGGNERTSTSRLARSTQLIEDALNKNDRQERECGERDERKMRRAEQERTEQIYMTSTAEYVRQTLFIVSIPAFIRLDIALGSSAGRRGSSQVTDR